MAVDDPVPLRIQVAVREMSGAPVAGQPRRAGSRHPTRIAALVLSGVLTVPVAVTIWYALGTPVGIGLGNFGAVLTDSSVWAAVGHSALWALAALLLVLLGLAIALLSQRVRRRRPSPLLVLVIPLGMSSLVAGAIFRLIFDQAPQRGTVNAVLAAFGAGQPAWLGSNLVWVVLIAAFGWSWLGFVVSLFRAGLDTIPPDIVRVAKAEGAGSYRRLRGIVLPLLRPVFAVVLLTMVVAAVRMFDLVLMVAPDPAQLGTDVLATRWWRMTTSTSDTGRPAALAVVLFALLIVVALGCIRGLRHRSAPRDGAEPPDEPSDEVVPTRPWLRRGLSALGVVIIAVWLFPLVTLLATAVRSPKDAGMFAWWRPGLGGLSTEALTGVADAGIWNGILDTFVVAVTATTLVLVVAVPAAYVLAWGGLPRWVTRVSVPLFAVLAVAPVQMYAEPLERLLGRTGLAGSQLPLAVVHAAVGAPFAVLVLRWAFASAPAPTAGRGGSVEPDRGETVLGWAWRHTRSTLIAVIVLEFVLVWNDFAVGFLISGPEASPLSLVLRGEARQFATSAAPVAASAALSSIVPVLVLLLTWRRVVAGLSGGVPR
ncbi:MAG TPA: ABC transporter permease subunit [Pseudonocardiaceae bacterium]|nr:ABC transporter permease subunit [Pseudonocardiaceae bacterium]